jgi:hypothetical protein
MSSRSRRAVISSQAEMKTAGRARPFFVMDECNPATKEANRVRVWNSPHSHTLTGAQIKRARALCAIPARRAPGRCRHPLSRPRKYTWAIRENMRAAPAAYLTATSSGRRRLRRNTHRRFCISARAARSAEPFLHSNSHPKSKETAVRNARPFCQRDHFAACVLRPRYGVCDEETLQQSAHVCSTELAK